MTKRHIFAIVNESTLVKASEIPPVIDALAHQIRYHVAPAWDMTTASVIFYPELSMVPPGAWIIALIDDPDQAGALAYHSETPDGRPYGKVFVRTCMENNVSWTSALSHEVVEAFVDPNCNMLADDYNGRFYALEVCDPVESTGYLIDDVEVSDFVRPAWFDAQSPHEAKVRWVSKGTDPLAPFALDRGGYAVFYEKGHWHQDFNRKEYAAWRLSGKNFGGSRTARRVR